MVIVDTPNFKNGGWSHMAATTVDELHAFAALVGLKRCWFQNKRGKNQPHYDIKWPLTAKAIHLGASQVSRKDLYLFLSPHTMKVICILQNAWGNGKLPYIFAPNPHNKSAKVIQTKVLHPTDVMHFANTTGVMTPTAKGKPCIDNEHFKQVIKRLKSYDLILVCGIQAKKAVLSEQCYITQFNKPIVYMPHPASRSLSNAQLQLIKEQINHYRNAFKS